MPRPKKEKETVAEKTEAETAETKTEAETAETKTETSEAVQHDPQPLLTDEERAGLLEVSAELHRSYSASNNVQYRQRVQRLRGILSALLER